MPSCERASAFGYFPRKARQALRREGIAKLFWSACLRRQSDRYRRELQRAANRLDWMLTQRGEGRPSADLNRRAYRQPACGTLKSCCCPRWIHIRYRQRRPRRRKGSGRSKTFAAPVPRTDQQRRERRLRSRRRTGDSVSVKRLCQQDSRNGEWLITIEEPFDWVALTSSSLSVPSLRPVFAPARALLEKAKTQNKPAVDKACTEFAEDLVANPSPTPSFVNPT